MENPKKPILVHCKLRDKTSSLKRIPLPTDIYTGYKIFNNLNSNALLKEDITLIDFLFNFCHYQLNR